MAQQQHRGGAGQGGDRVSSAGDAIPMKKTGATTYIAIGVGVLAIGGIVLATKGGSDEAAEKKAAEIKAQVAKKEAPTMSVKEQQEHMKMTARAFEKAAETAAAKKAEEERKQAEAQATESEKVAAAAPPPAAAGASQPKAAAPVNKKAAKKQMDSLDSMGSDIASALK